MTSPITARYRLRDGATATSARSLRLADLVQRARSGGRAAVGNQGRVRPALRRAVRPHALGGGLHRLHDLGCLLVLHGVQNVEADTRLEPLGTVGWSAQLHYHG